MGLTPKEQAQFKTLGYVIKEGIYSYADLEPLREGLTGAIQEKCDELITAGRLDRDFAEASFETRLACNPLTIAREAYVRPAINSHIPIKRVRGSTTTRLRGLTCSRFTIARGQHTLPAGIPLTPGIPRLIMPNHDKQMSQFQIAPTNPPGKLVQTNGHK